MMHSQKTMVFILSVLLSNIHLQAQSGKTTLDILDQVQYIATYNYVCQEDSIAKTSMRQTLMNLYIGNNISKFEHNGRYTRNSIWINSTLEGSALTQQIISQTSGNLHHMLAQYKIIKQNKSNQIDLYERILRQYYHINEEINYNWKLLNSPDTLIAGYKCRKAQTVYRGRQYNAWYTPEIPINDGPYKFKGLPGLIVKMEDTRKQHCFEMESFSKINYEKPIYFYSKNYIEIDIDKYPKLKHNEAINRSGRISRQVDGTSTDKLGNVEAKILSRNNIIEKY